MAYKGCAGGHTARRTTKGFTAMATATTATKATTAPAAAVKAAPATQYVALLVPGNPKKPNSASAARFALYKHGCTVAAYRDAVVKAGQPGRLAAADLLWDVRHGFIALSATPPAPQATPKA